MENAWQITNGRLHEAGSFTDAQCECFSLAVGDRTSGESKALEAEPSERNGIGAVAFYAYMIPEKRMG